MQNNAVLGKANFDKIKLMWSQLQHFKDLKYYLPLLEFSMYGEECYVSCKHIHFKAYNLYTLSEQIKSKTSYKLGSLQPIKLINKLGSFHF